MIWQELNKIKEKELFIPETAEVEALLLFANIKRRMALLGWVYEGSLRWSENARMMRVVYETGKRIEMELWHMDGSNDLVRRISVDSTEDGMADGLNELGIKNSPTSYLRHD